VADHPIDCFGDEVPISRTKVVRDRKNSFTVLSAAADSIDSVMKLDDVSNKGLSFHGEKKSPAMCRPD